MSDGTKDILRELALAAERASVIGRGEANYWEVLARDVVSKLIEIGFTDDMDRKVQEERLEHDLNFNEEAAYRAALWVILGTPSTTKGE